jgi:hypothetical protein
MVYADPIGTAALDACVIATGVHNLLDKQTPFGIHLTADLCHV